eukprot:g444.t1
MKKDAQAVESFVYRHDMDAKIDLSKRLTDRAGVFNWDDVVVDLYSGLSYHEKKLMGFKVSPRDMMISQYLQDCGFSSLTNIMQSVSSNQYEHVHYRNRRLCRHNHLETCSRAVEFGDGSRVLDFFTRNEYLFSEPVKRSGLSNVFTFVLNSGLFLRAAITRSTGRVDGVAKQGKDASATADVNSREFIYWLPGLNAGIPLVPKDDAIHEVTFQAHDLAHFLLPDLIFTGHDSPLGRRLYIIYRMLSEAITLVFADMLFVEQLRRSGLQYDWCKRQIWPLFRDLQVDPFGQGVEHFLATFRSLLEANISYCLLGDDGPYRQLLGAGLEESLFRAFARYMMGQCVLFARFNFLPEAETCHKEILQVLTEAARNSSPPRLGEEELHRARSHYESFVDLLLERQLITLDDAKTFKEERMARACGAHRTHCYHGEGVCPLFDPCFAAYDEPLSHYEQLQKVSQEIIGESPSGGYGRKSERPRRSVRSQKGGAGGAQLRWVPKHG